MNDTLMIYPGGPIRTEFKLLALRRVEQPNARVADLAAGLGYAYLTVLNWLKRPDYQAYENWLINKVYEPPPEVREARVRVQEKFETHAEEMQDRLLGILDHIDDPKIHKEIALEWLDRAGHAVVRKHEVRQLSMTLTADALQLLEQRSREAGLTPFGTLPPPSPD